MKNRFILILTIALFGFLSFSACKKSCNQSDIDKATTNYINALTAYSNDPENKDKCNAFKSAINDFLDEVDGCDGVSQSEIDEVKNSLADLNCN